MKQIISMADMATIYTLVGERICSIENPFLSPYDDREKEKKEHKKQLAKNHYYQSLLRVRKTLENCNLEIEVPDIETKGDK